MSNKNRGRTLFYSQLGGVQPIPPEFIAAMHRQEEITSVPNEVQPEALSDLVVESKVETDRTGERELRTIKKIAGPIVLRGVNTNDQGSPVQVTLTLIRTEDVGQIVPTATTNVAVKDLGNEFSIIEVETEGYYDSEGNFRPRVFGGDKWEREREDLTPQKFKHQVETVSHRIDSAGIAVDPTLTDPELRESQEQITTGKKRVEVVSRDDPPLPTVLTGGVDTSQEKQDVVVTEILQSDQTAVPISSALKDVQADAVGDGRLHVKVREVASVFAHPIRTVEIPDTVPSKFRVAVPTTTTQDVIEGKVVLPPILGVGDLQKSEEQINVFHKRVSKTSRGTVPVPQSLVSSRTSEKKQVVTITETYRDNTTATPPNGRTDVKVDNLGDGREIETVEQVPIVFNNKSIQHEVTDPIPQEFRTTKPYENTEETFEALINVPNLGATGELARTEEQIDKFNKKVRITKRTQSVNADTHDSEVDGMRVGGSFFNGTVSVTRSIRGAMQTVGSIFGTIFSRVKSLSETDLLTLKEHATIDAYPTLTDYIHDPETKTFFRRVKKLINSAGYSYPGGYITDRQIDKDHIYREDDTPDPATIAAFLAYVKVFPSITNVDLPPQLVELKAVYNSGGGGGTFSEDGTCNIVGKGSTSLSLGGSANASGSVLPDVYPVIRQPTGANITCLQILFYIADGTTMQQILDRLTTILGLPFPEVVTEWPKFTPKECTIICKGQQVSANARASCSLQASVRTKYDGTVANDSVVSGGSIGSGASLQVETTIKVVRIPPTIHPALNISGLVSVAYSDSWASAQITSLLGGIPANVLPIEVQALATGTVEPTSVPSTGTSGTNGIPATLNLGGYRLHRLRGEPGPLGFTRMFAEVINFTTIPGIT